MPRPKVAIIFYSATGNTHRVADSIAEGARAAGAEVRLRRVAELAPESAIRQNPAWQAYHETTRNEPTASLEDLEWADAIILGTPTRFGSVSSQLKQFIDQTGGLWFEGKLADKVVAGFVTADNPHGGQEATILSMYNTFYHWGSIIAAPGYTDRVVFTGGGNPYGVSATRAGNEGEHAAARYLGQRVATVSEWVMAGRDATVPR